ncbi:MAG: hypothetical protein JNM59_10300 [Hyphomonadaceae bacterium]|nr:hypothetical protein [Hyphomonadaceae bacterium]
MRSLRALAVFLALAACAPPPPTAYAPGVEQNFMRACEAQSTVPGLCACTWDRIEAGIAPADFAALEALPGPERQAHPLTQQIEGYALACGADLDGEVEPAAP